MDSWSSAFRKTGGHIGATVLLARDELKFEFLSETDFRGVVAVEGDAFKDKPEVAFELGIGLGNGVAVARSDDAIAHDGVVDGAKLGELLFGGGVGEILAVERLALLVDTAEAVEET